MENFVALLPKGRYNHPHEKTKTTKKKGIHADHDGINRFFKQTIKTRQ